MSNIVIPDGGNIGSASDPDAISIASSGKPTFSQGIANTGTIDAGILGDNINVSSKYFLHGKVTNTTGLGGSDHYIDTEGTSNPYFTLTGDTTNIDPDSTNNLKIIRAGIYFINFSATCFLGSGTSTRVFTANIAGGTSVNPTASLASGKDQVNNVTSDSDFGNASISFCGALTANYYIRFFISGADSSTNIHNASHINVILIRPTA
jgi:hypothetical protein